LSCHAAAHLMAQKPFAAIAAVHSHAPRAGSCGVAVLLRAGAV
jgi:hypothetical protein